MPTKTRVKSPIVNFRTVFKNRRIISTFTFRFENGKMYYFKGDTIISPDELQIHLPTEFNSKAFSKRLQTSQV